MRFPQQIFGHHTVIHEDKKMTEESKEEKIAGEIFKDRTKSQQIIILEDKKFTEKLLKVDKIVINQNRS